MSNTTLFDFQSITKSKSSSACSCGSTQFRIEERPPHLGKFCSGCGRWQKWLRRSKHDLSPPDDLLRAIIEIASGELKVFPIAGSDGDERRIFDALRFVMEDLRP